MAAPIAVLLAVVAMTGPTAAQTPEPATSQAQTLAPSPAQEPAALGPRLLAARTAVQRHADALRLGLSEALRNGGVKAAVGACVSLAPEIDSKVEEQTGFVIGRTALKVRNPENAPNPWEKATLEAFAAQLARGGDPKMLEANTIETTSDGQRLFRYMRPIMMVETCLSCHGPNVAQEIKAMVARTYSDDKAIGFNLGELRGAFSLVQVLD